MTMNDINKFGPGRVLSLQAPGQIAVIIRISEESEGYLALPIDAVLAQDWDSALVAVHYADASLHQTMDKLAGSYLARIASKHPMYAKTDRQIRAQRKTKPVKPVEQAWPVDAEGLTRLGIGILEAKYTPTGEAGTEDLKPLTAVPGAEDAIKRAFELINGLVITTTTSFRVSHPRYFGETDPMEFAK